MSSVQFNFPPESYSAVYTSDGTTNANVVGKCNVSESCEVSGTPTSIVHTPPSSLFSCFHCAFQNGINFTRKEKRRKENHTNHKVAVPGKEEKRWRNKDEGALFKRWGRNASPVEATSTPAPTAPASQPSELLKFLAINALELSAPASDALLKSRSSEWFQLAGPGSLALAARPRTVWKRRAAGDHPAHNPSATPTRRSPPA
ncbi:uncharacterized protein LOC113507024, partial [Trichoplusia ni]|uniref:Uncharacterized protein LOC113507024 n=1 Tax=Trichoplusia ni TaxID=7111 RepID=A0A7E5WZM2_TRINI